jgi:hypothetical protein
MSLLMHSSSDHLDLTILLNPELPAFEGSPAGTVLLTAAAEPKREGELMGSVVTLALRAEANLTD